AERRGSDEHGAPGLADGERGTGVDADERLLEHDGPRLVLLQQLDDAVEDRLQAQLRTAPGGRLPPAVVDRPEAPAFLVDDAVTACCRTRIDAQDLHGATLRTGSDASLLPQSPLPGVAERCRLADERIPARPPTGAQECRPAVLPASPSQPQRVSRWRWARP